MRTIGKPKRIVRKAFQILDTLLFSVLLTLLILPYLDIFHRLWIVILVFLFIIFLVLTLRTRYQTVKQKKDMYLKEEQRTVEQLLLLSDGELSDRFGKNNFILIRKERPDRFDVMEALRKHTDAIGLFSEDKALTELIRSYSPDTAIYCRHDLFEFFKKHKEEAVADQTSYEKAFSLICNNKYIMLGILFLIASFLLRSKIYYRVLATACLIIAPVTGIFNDRKSRKNFRIFLDKMDD